MLVCVYFQKYFLNPPSMTLPCVLQLGHLAFTVVLTACSEQEFSS